jgi:hypothetical protein
MKIEEIGLFSAYVVELCGTDPQSTATMASEFMGELRAVDLSDAKSALRAVLATGKVPYGAAKIFGAVLSVIKDRTRSAATYDYDPGETYRHERAMIRDARPDWDALDDDERNHRLRMAAKRMGDYELRKGKWVDAAGRRVPASVVERHALLELAKTLQETA